MFHLLFLWLLIPWFIGGRNERRTSDTHDDHAHDTRRIPEARLYKLAASNRGVLTVSDVVVDLGIPVAEAEALLESMVDERYVRMNVAANGSTFFEFPELIPD